MQYSMLPDAIAEATADAPAARGAYNRGSCLSIVVAAALLDSS